MRLQTLGLIGIAALAVGGVGRAQSNPFAGAWNITPEAPARGVYWLEVKDEGGQPAVLERRQSELMTLASEVFGV